LLEGQFTVVLNICLSRDSCMHKWPQRPLSTGTATCWQVPSLTGSILISR